MGVGSLLLIAGALGSRPETPIGFPFRVKDTTRKERIVFAAEVTGAILVAGGSLIVALSQMPAWRLIAATLVFIVICCDLLMAWPLKRRWDHQLEVAELVASTGGNIGNSDSVREKVAIAHQCATWRWCLLHPLHTDSGADLESSA